MPPSSLVDLESAAAASRTESFSGRRRTASRAAGDRTSFECRRTAPRTGGSSERFSGAISATPKWPRELGQLALGDALALCRLIREQAPDRYERAAVRWHRPPALEEKLAAIAASQAVLSAVAGLRGRPGRWRIGLLREIGDRYRVVGV